MEKFFAQIVLLDTGTVMALGLATVILGGIFAALVFDVRIELRRAIYFCLMAVLYMGVSLVSLMWSLTPMAAEAGFFSFLVIFIFGMIFLFGVATYYASAARSLHAWGTTGYAWLGFVPLLNLVLIFKRGKDFHEAPMRSSLSRFVADPALVILGLIFVVAANSIDKAVERSGVYSIDDSPKLAKLVSDSMSVEELFAWEVKNSRTSLPLTLDEYTILRDMRSSGKTITFVYDLRQDMPSVRIYNPDFKEYLADEQCMENLFGSALKRGGTVEFEYRNPDGSHAQTYSVTGEDC